MDGTASTPPARLNNLRRLSLMFRLRGLGYNKATARVPRQRRSPVKATTIWEDLHATPARGTTHRGVRIHATSDGARRDTGRAGEQGGVPCTGVSQRLRGPAA